MTLNRVMALILHFVKQNSIALLANYVTVVEGRPMMSAKYRLSVAVFHFWPKLTHPAARSLCDSWASCYELQCTCCSVVCNLLQDVSPVHEEYRLWLLLRTVRHRVSCEWLLSGNTAWCARRCCIQWISIWPLSPVITAISTSLGL